MRKDPGLSSARKDSRKREVSNDGDHLSGTREEEDHVGRGPSERRDDDIDLNSLYANHPSITFIE